MLLGAVLKETGNASPMAVPAKGRYIGPELQRWAKHYGAPFVANAFFPINTLRLMRGAVAAQQGGSFLALSLRYLSRSLDRGSQFRGTRSDAIGPAESRPECRPHP